MVNQSSLDSHIDKSGLTGDKAREFIAKITRYLNVNNTNLLEGVIFLKSFKTGPINFHFFNIMDTAVYIEDNFSGAPFHRGNYELNIEIASSDKNKINRAKKTLTEMTGIEFYYD